MVIGHSYKCLQIQTLNFLPYPVTETLPVGYLALSMLQVYAMLDTKCIHESGVGSPSPQALLTPLHIAYHSLVGLGSIFVVHSVAFALHLEALYVNIKQFLGNHSIFN